MDSMLLWDYTSNELRETAADHIVVQPIGAVEQHGPHLPLGTDSMIIGAFAQRLQQRLGQEKYPALFLPLIPYGKSNEHIDFPGTVTFSLQTFIQVLMDIGSSCARAGFQKLVFLNGHGGNHEVLDMITRELRIKTGMQVFALHPLLKIMPDTCAQEGSTLSSEETRFGIHAGRIETSIILHLAPGLVREDLLERDYPVNFEGCSYLDFSEKIPFGWMTQDVSRTGTIGNPVGATGAEGERWLSGVTDALCRAFQDIKQYIPQRGEV